MRIGFMLLCSTVLFINAGCSGQHHPTARLEGRVSVGSHLIEHGNITFTPLQANRGVSVLAKIESGVYVATQVPRGKVRVDFHAVQETGKTVMQFGKPYPETVNIIPDKYRVGFEIEIDGDNIHKDFNL